MILAAVDIGSNAIRLAMFEVLKKKKDPFFKRVALYRIPIRLGSDAFVIGRISDKNIMKLISAMHAFRHIIDVYEPRLLRACATSAMRDARNGEALRDRIQNECNIPLEIISGKEEADIIFSSHIAEELNPNTSYLYIDVGGGSTELTVFNNGKLQNSMSFQIGTIRMLKDVVKRSEWSNMFDWISKNVDYKSHITAIGSGGNINKLYKITKNAKNLTLSLDQLSRTFNILKESSFEERIIEFNMRSDRADVIIPAAEIYSKVMKKAGIKKIYIPQIGLSDGIIHKLYEEMK